MRFISALGLLAAGLTSTVSAEVTCTSHHNGYTKWEVTADNVPDIPGKCAGLNANLHHSHMCGHLPGSRRFCGERDGKLVWQFITPQHLSGRHG
ncbi:hypothetical protein PG997_013956 [Apiospora hydei]|uniref:Uncharacterized protein n=1 Tax=Apiospora hydei TaxID=1337664 RepID=A0ABR1V7N5_9PEZI